MRNMFEVGWAVVRGCGYVARYNTFSEEGMIDDLVESGSVFRFSRENVLHKLLCIRRYLTVSRERVIIVTNTPNTRSALYHTSKSRQTNSLIDSLDIFSLERRASHHESV